MYMLFNHEFCRDVTCTIGIICLFMLHGISAIKETYCLLSSCGVHGEKLMTQATQTFQTQKL